MITVKDTIALELHGHVCINGKIIQRRNARKAHSCKCCGITIVPGPYYEITLAGSGLGSIKYPDRVHSRCLDNYLDFDARVYE